MPDWLIECGIGETRAVRLKADEIVEARILLDGVVPVGTVLEARLATVGRPAIAEVGSDQYLLPSGAPGITQGARLVIEVTRERVPGSEAWKRPLARLTDEAPRPPTPFDAEYLAFPSPDDQLVRAGWSDVLDEARSGIVRFAGGELRISPTPAMTLIDVDGQLSAFELALAGAEAAAQAILRHGIGGSIGIDLPTVGGKAQRQEIAAAVDSILPQPFERTAVNGFGFLQIVRARAHASLFELAQDRAAFEARALLRRAALERIGAVRLVAHPAVVALLETRAHWIDVLAGQIGGTVALRADPSLPMSAGYAERI